MKKKKYVFVTWHYTSYGIAYLKHILSAFYSSFSNRNEPTLGSLSSPFRQEKMNEVFNNPIMGGFKFDKIFYLTAPQKSFDGLSSRRKYRYKDEEQDESNYGLKDCFDALKDQSTIFRASIKGELDYIEKHFPEKKGIFGDFLWRNIQYYPISEQIRWLKDLSNFGKVYKKEDFVEVKLDIADLRDEKAITDAVMQFVKERLPDSEEYSYVINISLGSNETQVAWHILSQSGCLPSNIRFIKTYDDKKDDTSTRFKPFTIRETETKLIETLSSNLSLYPETHSPKRALADKLMKSYLESGFSVLILGDRGIGKTSLIERHKENKRFVEANCASFAEDTMAESDLFGYIKGAFTGASSDKNGLIKEAENGILFLDEVHRLSERVQSKLLTAFRTNENNELSIRKVGATVNEKVKNVRLVFASNLSIDELKEKLLPDFYDRIVQHVIKLPSLDETKEDIEKDWEQVWKQLKFEKEPETPKEKPLISWLSKQPLKGNYRDLQRIAMYYHIYQVFDDETRAMIPQKTPLAFAKAQFQEYISYEPKREKLFSKGKTYEEMNAEYHKKLEEWAIRTYNTRANAALQLGVSEKTLNNWKNKK